MKHTLLHRQLRKHFPPEHLAEERFASFFEAVDKSYRNYEDKLSMIQRATALSSDELYRANIKLREEELAQKKTIRALEKAIAHLDEPEIQNNRESARRSPEDLSKRIISLATELRALSLEKDALVAKLEIQNNALNNYAQMVSHDLKSPIRNISALMAWIMEDNKGKLAKDNEENCGLILANLEKMDHLIDGILQHATMGETTEERIHFNLGDCLTEIVQTIYVPNNIEIIQERPLPDLFMEKDRIKQIFTNLLTNAITATEEHPKGVITIGHEPGEEYWKFWVADNGKGIAPRHQQGIFEMFKKLDNDTQSVGIGLALVKKIVNLYQGSIWLTSTEGQGTTFFIKLKKQ